jgi:prepilin-type N-terminal cleavage/methylation domain-containing protein
LEGIVETREKGFSLIELMVAMVVTLIISGAVFQLVTAGQSAFRKEPAVADRQQNIRMGLDLISQDLFQAGSGVPEFAQVFTRNLDKTGPAMGSGGELADQLELVRAMNCPYLTVCKDDGTNLFTKEPVWGCYQLPANIIIGCDTPTDPNDECPNYDVVFGFERGAGDQKTCKNGHVNAPHGQNKGLNPPGGKHNFTPQWIMLGDIVRYRIRNDADGVPNLERSLVGDAAKDASGNNPWQIIARGVEDLQVQYETNAGGTLAWRDDPGLTSTADTLVRRVRVRLSARVTETGHMTGETKAAGLPNNENAIRGQLSTEVAPRAATATLAVDRGEL